ncbi:MAG: hypothetical protein JXA21_14025 [Anaerolineae bacterium]|nr:hypothetical protein [Anaerolineae bacterium]
MFTKYLAQLVRIVFAVAVSCAFCVAQPAWVQQRKRGEAGSDFLFGLGYMTENLAAPFAEIGASQAKLNYGMSHWEEIEPDPPVDGNHTYHWSNLDSMIAEYQAHGFSETHITLKAKSAWGTQGCTTTSCVPYLPRPEHWQDYEAYVRAVVERYDNDGIDDMPGLLYPVRQYEIETEADALWPNRCMEDPDDPDRASTYLQVLASAQQVAREAYPDVQILPAAMLFYGLFSGEPDAAAILERRSRDTVESRAVNCVAAFNEEILRHPEYFDAVEFHYLGDDYREIATTIHWLYEQMERNNYRKPIYPTDLPTGPALVPTSFYKEEFHLYPQDVAKDYLDIIRENIASDPPSQEYLDIRTWYAGEQAAFTVKLLLATMEEGGAGVQLASMTDFNSLLCYTPSFYVYAYEVLSWAIHGMADMGWTSCLPACLFFGNCEVQQPRPVFYTLRWFVANLGDFDTVERLDMVPDAPGAADVYAYQVQAGDRVITVFWAEDGIGQVMDEPKSTVTLTLPASAPVITVTHTITQVGQTEPTLEFIAATEQVTLTVGESPVFVEGLQPQQPTPQYTVYLPVVLKGGE